MEGVNRNPFQRAEQNFEAPGAPIVTRRRAVERLKLAKNIPLEEYLFSKSVATKPVRQTVLSADRISQRFDLQNSRDVYQSMDEFLADVVAISRHIVRGLIQAGCRYISIDAPGYTAYVDSVSLERMRSRGEDPDENLARSIAADNAIIDGFAGVTFGIHLCRGNPRTVDPKTGKVVAQWHREGYYDAIAERVFQGLNHHRFLLESSAPVALSRCGTCRKARSRSSDLSQQRQPISNPSTCSSAELTRRASTSLLINWQSVRNAASVGCLKLRSLRMSSGESLSASLKRQTRSGVRRERAWRELSTATLAEGRRTSMLGLCRRLLLCVTVFLVTDVAHAQKAQASSDVRDALARIGLASPVPATPEEESRRMARKLKEYTVLINSNQ
jgi:hypothetical protein